MWVTGRSIEWCAAAATTADRTNLYWQLTKAPVPPSPRKTREFDRLGTAVEQRSSVLPIKWLQVDKVDFKYEICLCGDFLVEKIWRSNFKAFYLYSHEYFTMYSTKELTGLVMRFFNVYTVVVHYQIKVCRNIELIFG